MKRWRGARVGGGELEEEDGAAPFIGTVADRSAVGVDDAVAHREAEARAFPYRLRREEGLEQLRFVFRRHTRPVVPHLDAHALAGVVQADEDAAFAETC